MAKLSRNNRSFHFPETIRNDKISTKKKIYVKNKIFKVDLVVEVWSVAECASFLDKSIANLKVIYSYPVLKFS